MVYSDSTPAENVETGYGKLWYYLTSGIELQKTQITSYLVTAETVMTHIVLKVYSMLALIGLAISLTVVLPWCIKTLITSTPLLEYCVHLFTP